MQSLGSRQSTVYLDVGGSMAGKSEYQQVRLKSILQGDQLMGLEAHNIGGPETVLSPNVLSQIGKEASITWLSANLQPIEDAKNISPSIAFASHKLIERPGISILVTGVIDPALVENQQWRPKDAATSVLAILKEKKADVVVVLAYMNEAGLRSLAESLPEVDFIVGGPTGQSLPPTTVGPVQVMSATNKGKFLADIELVKLGKVWKAKKLGAAEVVSRLDRDATQSKNIQDYLKVLAERDFPATETGLVASTLPAGATKEHYQVAGSESCTKCHQVDDQVWHGSKHAHAWKTLVDKQSQVDPSCQKCHTTAYGLPGGFVRVAESQQVVNVGCESCHGPSASHVLDPKVKTPYLSREQCVRCHDHENSPEFAYPAYWPKITHGQAKAEK